MDGATLRRSQACILILTLILGTLSGFVMPAAALGSESRYSDTSGHWARAPIERWSDYGVLGGYGDVFRPNNLITRAEMAAILVRVMGYPPAEDNPFSDLSKNKWYYGDVLKLAAAGIMVGYDGKARAGDNITREEAASVLTRAFHIAETADDPNPFRDNGQISPWAVGAVGGLHRAGYVAGKPGDIFDPQGYLTRAEAVTMIGNIIAAFYNAAGEYEGNVQGNALLRAGGATLSNMQVSGNLYLTPGIGAGSIALNEVLVGGTTYLLGASGLVTVAGGNLGTVEIDSPRGVHLAFTDGAGAEGITLRSTATITVGGRTMSFDGASGLLALDGPFEMGEVGPGGRLAVSFGGLVFEIVPPAGTTVTLANGTNGALPEEGSGSGGSDEDAAPPVNRVTVSFQSNGGSEIAPIQVSRGSTLPLVPMPVKENYAFIGWYTDSALNNDFYSDAPIENNLILYASYVERAANLQVFTEPNKHLEDCEPDFSVSILSPVVLTEANLPEYVELSSYGADIPDLNVTGDGPIYTLSPKAPYYIPGGLYELILQSAGLSFQGQETAVRQLSFRIKKDETEEIDFKATVKNVLWADATDLGEGAYTVPADKYTIIDGDVVRFWNGAYDEEMRYRKVLLVTPLGEAGDVLLLNTEACEIGDVFQELDFYGSQAIPLANYLDQIDTQAIALNAKNSEGARQMTAMLNEALAQSPTLMSLAGEEDGYFRTPSETEDYVDIPIGYLFDDIEDLEVTCTVAGTNNANFNPYNQHPETVAKYGEDYSPVLTLVFKYSTDIKGKARVEAEVTIKEYLSASLQGGGGINIWKLDFEFDYAVNLYSQTDIFLTVFIKSIDKSEEFSYEINVTEEIGKLLKKDEEEEGDDPAAILKKVLGDKGDYITLVEAKIIEIPIEIGSPVPVAEIKIELDFVIKVNFAAGISSKITVLSARQIGVAASTKEGYLRSYNNELFGNNRYAIDIYAAGYVGFKAGLKGSISVALPGLEDLGKVGASLEFGAYVDIYGFVHALILKTYPNDYANMGTKKSEISGAIYMELGLYLEIELFAESKEFKAKASASLLDKKFRLCSVGDRYVLSRFKDNTGRILMHTESLSLLGEKGLLEAEFIDMTTGETLTGSFAKPARFTLRFSSPYFSVKNNAIVVDTDLLPPGTKRINDVTVYIYYDGSALTFTGPTEIYYDINGKAVSIETPKVINLTWIDPDTYIEGVSDIDTVKATYVVNIDGQATVIEEREVLFAEAPGAANLFPYFQSHHITQDDNDYDAAITEDTVYTIYMTPLQRLVSFLTFYGGEWHFDVYAVNSGEVPQSPAGYNSSGPELTFTKWLLNSGYWAYSRGDYYPESIIPMDEAGVYGNANIFHGLNTTLPLYSVSGSEKECIDAYYHHIYEGSTFNFLCLARYDAQYRKAAYDVTIRYPAMEYSALGTTIRQAESSWTRAYEHGEQVVIRGTDLITYYGCDMLGWDTNGDGIADYDPENPPLATQDMTFSAVMQIKTYQVTVLNHAAEPVEGETVNIGNLPAILQTAPEYPDGGAYEFRGWGVSKDGGTSFVNWDARTNPGVYENWTVKPQYEGIYTVTFSYPIAGGGQGSFTKQLTAGTYPVADFIDFTPQKESDESYDYTFTAWDCGEDFTVVGDMTITALFAATPITYTVIFNTPHGELNTGAGGATHSLPSTYADYAAAAAAFLAENSTFADVYTEDRIYTFSHWGEPFVETVGHTVTYTAIWSYTVRLYTITFDGEDGYFKIDGSKTITYTWDYDTAANMFGEGHFVKDEDLYNTYLLVGWRDENNVTHLPGAAFTVKGDMTYTAVYEASPKTYTITLEAAGGKFDDGETGKTFSGAYGDATDINVEPPTRESDAPHIYDYDFEGWSVPLPETFTENLTINALWKEVYVEYTVTFEAGEGTFSGGIKTIAQNYHYGDTVTPPDAPSRPDDDTYTYTFYGWNNTITEVDGDMTYRAVYKAQLKDLTSATGITVSDGTNAEDISCNGESVSGYVFEYVWDYDETTQFPQLTITGNGLTFSGSSDSVYVVLADTCTSVTFADLKLQGQYGLSDGLLTTEDSEELLSVTILGACRLENAYEAADTIRIERPILFQGTGESSSLSIKSKGRDAIYNACDLEVNSLQFTVTAEAGTDLGIYTNGIMSDERGDLRFTDSRATVRGRGAINAGAVVLEGETYLVLESTMIPEESSKGISLVALSLSFIDFTGSFQAHYEEPGVTAPAVCTGYEITFSWNGSLIEPEELGTYYDMHGATTGRVVTDYDEDDQPEDWYYTFVDSEGGPLADVRISYLANED